MKDFKHEKSIHLCQQKPIYPRETIPLEFIQELPDVSVNYSQDQSTFYLEPTPSSLQLAWPVEEMTGLAWSLRACLKPDPAERPRIAELRNLTW